MNKKSILRVLGILFSILIIASVFLPYNKTDNLPLLVFGNVKNMILPGVIILFGIASALLYVTNKYCEFALSTSGAVLFFSIIEVVYAVSNKTVNEFGIGYYALSGSAILVFINTVLYTLSKPKNEEVVSTTTPVAEPINNNYNMSQQESSPIETIQQLNYQQQTIQPVMEQPQVVEPVQVVEPIVEQTVQPIQPIVEQPIIEQPQVVEPVQVVEPIVEQTIQPIQPVIEQPQVVEPIQPVVEPIVEQTVQPVSEVQGFSTLPDLQFEQMEEHKEPITPMYEEPKTVSPEDNPALKSLLPETENANPVVQEFNGPVQAAPVQPVNPVLEQFEQPGSFIGQPQVAAPVQPAQEELDNGVGMSIFNNH